jgi:hypothetical protein
VDEVEAVKMGWSQTGRKEMCILVHFEYESFWRGDYLTKVKSVREIVLSKVLEKRIVWVRLN